MAYVVEPKGTNKEVFLNILKGKAAEEGPIINLRQSDIIGGSNGHITNSATVSGYLSFYKEKGLIVQIERGTVSRPAKYDISALLKGEKEVGAPSQPILESAPESSPEPVLKSTEPLTPYELQTEIIKDEVVAPDPSAKSLAAISDTLKEVAFYLESIKEIKDPLQDMTAAIEQMEKGVDPTAYEEEIASLKEQLEQAKVRVEELESAPKNEFNKHLIYRSRNHILDEIERYFMTPGWQRKSKEDYFKMAISNHLTAIMKELKIESPIES